MILVEVLVLNIPRVGGEQQAFELSLWVECERRVLHPQRHTKGIALCSIIGVSKEPLENQMSIIKLGPGARKMA